MQKRLFAPLLLALLASGPVYAQVSDESVRKLDEASFNVSRDGNVEYNMRFLDNYLETDMGMTKDDYGRFQYAEGLVRENRIDKGLEMLQVLKAAYPTAMPINIQIAKAYLKLEKPEQALLVLQDAVKQLNPLEDDDQPMLLQLILHQVMVYQMQKQPGQALKVLQKAPLKPMILTIGEQEEYYLTLASLLFQTGQAEEAYHYLMAQLESGHRSERTREALQDWSPGIAEEMYRLSSAAYRENKFMRAQHLALLSYHLNPQPVKYTQLLAQAQDHVLIEVNQHFTNALPILGDSVRKLRFFLVQEDYPGLYKEYMHLRENKDVAFFLNPDYEGYLPANMQTVLREVETDLKARGFKF